MPVPGPGCDEDGSSDFGTAYLYEKGSEEKMPSFNYPNIKRMERDRYMVFALKFCLDPSRLNDICFQAYISSFFLDWRPLFGCTLKKEIE
jgi:hypothetical protein